MIINQTIKTIIANNQSINLILISSLALHPRRASRSSEMKFISSLINCPSFHSYRADFNCSILWCIIEVERNNNLITKRMSQFDSSLFCLIPVHHFRFWFLTSDLCVLFTLFDIMFIHVAHVWLFCSITANWYLVIDLIYKSLYVWTSELILTLLHCLLDLHMWMKIDNWFDLFIKLTCS